MLKSIQDEIRTRGQIKAGERVGVAVSGGADSVALLRALVDLRKRLGSVITALHFHHGIRGAEADRDEAFVAELAEKLGVECVIGRGDVPAHSKLSRQSLETAARELRYRFFESVLRSGTVEKIATAHTMDDQAETVLMRLLRGAGTRGLSGIRAEKDAGRFIRPMLGVRRSEIEDYLRSIGQDWREDASNEERTHFRNQVRHDLIPRLVKDFNPNIVEVLARSAALAQSEEEYWAREMTRLLPLVRLLGKLARRGGGRRSSPADAAIAFNLEAMRTYPLAVQRRLLLEALRGRAIDADSEHVEKLLELVQGKSKAAAMPGGWKASLSFRELRLEPPTQPAERAAGYRHALTVPGEAPVEEIKLLVQARLERIASEDAGYNSGQVPGELLLEQGLSGGLTVRNWQSGDRFWPGHSKSEKKVKEILQQLKVPAKERSLWPVVAAGDSLIWVRGARQRPVRVQYQNQNCRLIIDAREMP